MNSVVQRKLSVREHRASSLRRISTNTAKNVTNDAINSLSLTIGQRMILCGHVQSCANHLKEGSPRLACEARILIRDDYQRQSVLTKHTIDKQHTCTFAIDGIWHCR